MGQFPPGAAGDGVQNSLTEVQNVLELTNSSVSMVKFAE